MAYKLVISDRADEMIFERVGYLMEDFSSEKSAAHLIAGIESVYDRLEDNPISSLKAKMIFLQVWDTEKL